MSAGVYTPRSKDLRAGRTLSRVLWRACRGGESGRVLPVAGTMAAKGSGLQMQTVRNLLMAWLLTLPMAIILSGSLYWLFSHLL